MQVRESGHCNDYWYQMALWQQIKISAGYRFERLNTNHFNVKIAKNIHHVQKENIEIEMQVWQEPLP